MYLLEYNNHALFRGLPRVYLLGGRKTSRNFRVLPPLTPIISSLFSYSYVWVVLRGLCLHGMGFSVRDVILAWVSSLPTLAPSDSDILIWSSLMSSRSSLIPTISLYCPEWLFMSSSSLGHFYTVLSLKVKLLMLKDPFGLQKTWWGHLRFFCLETWYGGFYCSLRRPGMGTPKAS